MDTTTKTLTSLTDRVSSLDLTYARMEVDTDITIHHTTLLRDQLTRVVDGLEIKSMFMRILCPLVEMIDCIKELSDAKKGEGGSRGKKSEVPTRRSGGEGPSGEQSSIRGRGPSPRGGRGPSQKDIDRVMIVKDISIVNGSRARAV
ncbi:hypothetical protein F511_16428 [Dorcoceras hygrometricum]|uniref:Uncharacterized protein n=1 Tax=Dorcoceras hygrometricum TaxID=472368 RepID=A0A2Z7AGD5_9LAMI|nr:hypothetical protein F511_16428 [Dorcoceras hygrometricum]